MLKNLLNRILPTPPTPTPTPTPPAPPAPGANGANGATEPVTEPAPLPEQVTRSDAFLAQGDAREEAGDLPQAVALYRAAIVAAPRHARAHLYLGVALAAQGDEDGAIAAYRQVLTIDPRNPFGNYNLARLLVMRGDLERAGALVADALRAKPDFPQALELSQRILRDQGFAQEALAAARRVVEHDPANWLHRSFELLLLNFVDDIPADDLHRRHLELGVALEQANPVRFDRHRERGDARRPLRVGYVSGDFHVHPVTFFLAPVLEHHDRSQIEVFCYSLSTRRDAMTDRIRAATDRWCDASAMSDDEVADAIHADGIDVLIDLMGHSSTPRLGVFCRRPAPVQAAWLGYLNTTGLSRMDFRITDVRSDPPGISERVHAERLVRLPFSQWCYPGAPEHEIAPVPPFERHGHLTFGSFNASLKLTPATCRRWAEVMRQVPGSRLLICDINSDGRRAAILRDFASLGVATDRVAFVPRVAASEYMGLYNEVDITFDTFPYGGGTTTFDSLWMGVPVVAAIGGTPVSRSAAGILSALGLDDWVAPSVDRFVEVAVARAMDLQALRELRRTLRPRLQASPLTDLPGYTRDLEAAWRRMWLEKTS